jgi:hypothetical protein
VIRVGDYFVSQVGILHPQVGHSPILENGAFLAVVLNNQGHGCMADGALRLVSSTATLCQQSFRSSLATT